MMSKIFDKLFFIGPMSLGDSFVLSGMAHYYGDRCNELHMPALPQFYETIKTLYQDHDHIKVISLRPFDEGENQYVEENKLSRILRIELIRSKVKNFDIVAMWDLQLYSNYELSYGLRYSNFKLPKFIQGSIELHDQLSGGEPYILTHRYTADHPDGIPIDIQGFRRAHGLPDIKIIDIKEGMTANMMQFVKLIENAQEIHCVPSSFHCLVDSIKTPAKLFFHDVREKTAMAVNSQWNDYKWIVINYPNRV